MKGKGFSAILSHGSVAILLLSLFNILYHVVFYNTLEYHRDELLYFALGTHPAFGYATTPPLIGFISYGLIQIFGYSLFSVKIFPALLSGAEVWLVALIAKELGGKNRARILAAVGVIIAPITMRAFNLFQPVFLDIFFWTLGFLSLLRYMNTEKEKYLLLLGAVAGIGLLNKYLIILLFAGIILFLPFTKFRKVFSGWGFYKALLLAAVLYLPNLLWQIIHGFPVIDHMTALHDTQLVYVNRLDFLMEQLMMPNMASLLIIPGLFFLLFSRRKKDFRIIAFISLFVIVVLLLFRGKSYYTAGIFPVLIASGAVFWEMRIRKRWIHYLLVLVMVLFTLPILPLGMPVYRSDKMVKYFTELGTKYSMDFGRRWEDGTIHPLPQDYADMIGWEELTRITCDAYSRVENKEKCLIFCENYGQAGAISVIGKKYGLPEPISFHDTYRYWLPKFLEQEIEEFIYINDELGEDVNELFAEITEIARIQNGYAREHGTRVYLCRKPKRSFNSFYLEVLKREGII